MNAKMIKRWPCPCQPHPPPDVKTQALKMLPVGGGAGAGPPGMARRRTQQSPQHQGHGARCGGVPIGGTRAAGLSCHRGLPGWRHAQASQFNYGRSGPLWISGSVPDHQLEWSSADPASVINFANGKLESGEQVPACLDPARLDPARLDPPASTRPPRPSPPRPSPPRPSRAGPAEREHRSGRLIRQSVPFQVAMVTHSCAGVSLC